MTRTQRIKRIVDLADMRKRIASQRIAGSRQRHDTNLGKLADFRGYLDEYTQVLITPGGSMSAADASGLRSFITQIERTISALEQHTERSGRECARDLEAGTLDRPLEHIEAHDSAHRGGPGLEAHHRRLDALLLSEDALQA